MNSSFNSSRRKFIKNASLGMGALVLGPAFTQLSYSKGGNKLGVALVGLGSYSNYQLSPALQLTKNCYLAGIVTGTPSKAEDYIKKYNIPTKNIYNYQNFDEIANNKDIDIVYIVLPVSMHKEYTIRAAAAGKHVICEKPMALNAVDCEAMVTACKKHGRLLSIGYRLHFDPYNIELMRYGQKQVFGKVQKLDVGNGFVYGGDPNAWRLKKALAGGGGLMDMGTYCIQASRYTLGTEPLSVIARQEKTRPDLFKEVDETVFWDLKFPGGQKVTGKSSYNNNWSYLNAEAEHGKFGLEPAFYYNGLKGYKNNDQIRFEPMNQQAAQMDDFALCVLTNKQSRVPGEEGVKDMKVIDAIYRSLISGKSEIIG